MRVVADGSLVQNHHCCVKSRLETVVLEAIPMPKFPWALTIGAVGVISLLATIVAMPDGIWRSVFITASCVLAMISTFIWLCRCVNLGTAWSILRTCRVLGIRRICPTGVCNGSLARRVSSTQDTIRIMAVSGGSLIKVLKDEIVVALTERKADLRVLVAAPHSEFVRDVEESESPCRAEKITQEIETTAALLREYYSKAQSKQTAGKKIGAIEIRHYTTHFRLSMTICDDCWAWLTLSLPPKRAVQSMSLELSGKNHQLLRDCIEHFDKAWQLAESRGDVGSIKPDGQIVS